MTNLLGLESDFHTRQTQDSPNYSTTHLQFSTFIKMLFQIIPILQVLALAATPLVAGAPADAPLTTPAPSVAPAYPNMWFYNGNYAPIVA